MCKKLKLLGGHCSHTDAKQLYNAFDTNHKDGARSKLDRAHNFAD